MSERAVIVAAGSATKETGLETLSGELLRVILIACFGPMILNLSST
jgi:hypothetical protein